MLGGIWFAFAYPLVFLALLLAFLALIIWLLPKLWRGVCTLFRQLQSRLRPQP